MKRIFHCVTVLALLAILNIHLATASAQGTAFSYQGRLNSSGNVANGVYDFRFRLDADPAGGTVLGAVTNNAIGVTNGLFNTTIDFGAGFYNGSNYWLEVDVKTNLADEYIQLNPFQPLAPTPYAVFASTASNVSGTISAAQISGPVGAGNLAGTYGNALTLNNAGNNVAGTFTGSGANLTLLNANALASGTVPLARLGGITSNQLDGATWQLATNLNGGNAMLASNVVSGISITNAFITNSYFAGDGGGLTNLSAKAVAQAGAITNGQPNVAFNSTLFVTNTVVGVGNNDQDAILGIRDNFYGNSQVFDISIFGDNIYYWSADPEYYAGYLSKFNSTVAAGNPIGQSGIPQYMFNGHIVGLASDDRSCVEINVTYGTNGEYGSIMEFLPLKSAHVNINSGKFAHPLRLDGNGGTWVGNIPETLHTKYYTANAYLRVTTGGNTDFPAVWLDSEGLTGTPVPGALERAGGALWWTDDSANRRPVFTGSNGAGLTNLSAAQLTGGVIPTKVLPGFQSPYNTIGGGTQNAASFSYSTVGGGQNNAASGEWSTIGGGENNAAVNFRDTVGGGLNNMATGGAATIGGGEYNVASQADCTVGGGFYNQATNVAATVSGGMDNIASGNYATVPGGTNNLAAGDFSFAAGFSARATNQGAFVWSDSSSAAPFVSTNNNSFNSRAAGGYRLYTSSSGADGAGVYIAAGGNSWTTVSDRNAKKNFQAVDCQAVLDKLARVPVQQWNYKWEADGEVPNIGPMAQDFKHAFYPGRDDKGISTLEFDGVELAAIQGLSRKLEADNRSSEDRIRKLEAENAGLKARLDRLEQLLAGNYADTK